MTNEMTPLRGKGQSWQFGQVPRRSFHAPDVNDIDAVSAWFPATVPGNVRLDLLAQDIIPDPFWDEQYKAGDWVDEVDWWYRTTFKTELQPGERAFIRFHGLDYLSAVFANGQELARHEGMFSRLTVEVTDLVRNGSCALAVRLWGSSALPRRRLSVLQKAWNIIGQRLQGNWESVYPNRSAVLKTQMSFGWDFAPRVRTVGIWDEVEYIVTGDVFIEDCQVNVDPTGQGAVYLSLNRGQTDPLQISLTITPANFEGPEFRVPVSTFSSKLNFALPNPKLWQPWDRGFPHLYTLQVDIPGSSSLTKRFGIRSVELRDWQFWINGQNEFIRGLNWVPADVFPGRVTPADYAELLRLAKESGANMLRVWGGGLREKQAFYDRCDEQGMLIWQEFPFACMFLGAYPRDRRYRTLVEQEVADIVRQLDHHPSLVVWCGGNEFSPNRNKPLGQSIARSIQAVSRSPRPFLPASPEPGDAHNWRVWHGQAPFAAYQQEAARFLSEFGLQALPDRPTLEAMLPDPTTGWETHNGEAEKLRHYFELFLTETNGGQRPAPSLSDGSAVNGLEDLIVASQRAQATGLQIAIEHMRRRKAQTGGVMVWQFNEPWPAISWAIVDYFRRPKLAYRLLKTWYNPILVCLEFTPGLNWQAGDVFEAVVWGVNDTLDVVGGASQRDAGRWRVTLDGEIIFEQEAVSLPPNSAVRVGEISYPLKQKPEKISVVWQAEEGTIAHNSYDLTWRDGPPAGWRQKFRRWMAEWLLR
jgi:beta-mannosidase